MRYIQKQNPPRLLTEWIQKNKNDINFNYDLLRQDKEAIQSLSDTLLKEQYYLCAYTGLRLDTKEMILIILNGERIYLSSTVCKN
jgi:hypothetical protein